MRERGLAGVVGSCHKQFRNEDPNTARLQNLEEYLRSRRLYPVRFCDRKDLAVDHLLLDTEELDLAVNDLREPLKRHVLVVPFREHIDHVHIV